MAHTTFDPVAAFQRGRRGAQQIEAAEQDVSQQRTKFGQQQALQKATILGQSAQALRGLPLNQRDAAFSAISPQLQKFGIDPAQFQPGSFTDVNLDRAIAEAQAFKIDPVGTAAKLQRGATFQVQTPQGPAIATNVFDPNIGTQRIETTQLGEGTTFISRIGESPAQETNRKVRQAQQTAKAQAEVKIETEPTIAGGKKAAEAAISQSEKAFEKLAKVSINIANFDDAIRLIDEGAETGPIVSKLPSFRQSTIELINVGNRLGLDVVGSTTFGALSESELAFAKSTALPVNLEPQDLKRWLQRKKAVQIKLTDELTKAAQFLGTPGNTIADFLALQELDKIDAEAVGQRLPVINGRQITEEDIETTMSANNMTRAQVLQRLGGGQ